MAIHIHNSNSVRPSGTNGSGPSRDKQFMKPNKKLKSNQSTVFYSGEHTKK